MSVTSNSPDMPRRSLVPIVILVLVWVLALGVIGWSQLNPILGMGVRMALALMSLFVAGLATWIWFVFASSFSYSLRMTVLLASLMVGIGLALTIRVKEVTGGLVPTFRFAWQPAKDAQ